MNNNLLHVVNTLIEQQGAAILDDSKRMRSLLKDLAPEEPKMEIIALVKCLEYNFHLNLKNIDDMHDRAQRKKQLVDQLYNNEGLDQRLCASGLELLEKVLFPQSPVYNDKNVTINQKPDVSTNDCNTVLTVDTNYIDALLERGGDYLDDEEYDLAINDFNAVLAIDPKNIDALFNRGVAYYYKEEYDLGAPLKTSFQSVRNMIE